MTKLQYFLWGITIAASITVPVFTLVWYIALLGAISYCIIWHLKEEYLEL
jgi:hypothetical protein